MRDSPNTFQDNGDGTVTDTSARLVWQQSVDPNTYSASAADDCCASLSLSGAGWRVPAITELESIIDFTRDKPAIDPRVFPATPAEVFVSSSRFSGPSPEGTRWLVHFGSGRSEQATGEGSRRVRCVRSDARWSQSSGNDVVPLDRYVVSDATVRDTRTRLTWQQQVDSNKYTQTQAAAYCQRLALAGGGWRTPTISELLTIVDRMRARPALDPSAFGTTLNAFVVNFWSSTVSPSASLPGSWGIGFADGQPFNGGLASDAAFVRCVR